MRTVERSNLVGCICRYSKMDLFESMHYYLNPPLEKLAKEQKTVFLLGDFHVDLLKYEKHKVTNEFLDSLSSNIFLPHIVQPTRITSHSKTLIDNIFSNYISQDIVLGNLTATIVGLYGLFWHTNGRTFAIFNTLKKY